MKYVAGLSKPKIMKYVEGLSKSKIMKYVAGLSKPRPTHADIMVELRYEYAAYLHARIIVVIFFIFNFCSD
jgi:hypothetical protein